MTKIFRSNLGRSWHKYLVGAAILSVCTAINMEAAELKQKDGMAPPPDYEQVTQLEFEMLFSKGTKEAMLLFIERHPQHPLADKARDRIEELAK